MVHMRPHILMKKVIEMYWNLRNKKRYGDKYSQISLYEINKVSNLMKSMYCEKLTIEKYHNFLHLFHEENANRLLS